MDMVLQEVRYALRSIRRHALLSAVVAGTLAIGIALVTTFFSLVNSAFFHPLPYRKADRVVTVAEYYVRKLPLEELRKVTTALSGLTAYEPTTSVLSGDGPAVSVSSLLIDTAFFRVIGEAPVLGSLPTPAEIANHQRFVVINERLWKRYFGGRPDIIGHSVTINGEIRRVIGVMPAWFTFPDRAEAWYPLDQEPGPTDRWLDASGELAPGKTFADLQRELLLVGARLHAIDSSTYHVGRTGGMFALPQMVGRGTGVPYYRLLAILVIGGALCVLLVACTNVGSLMLARAARRRGEMVVRASLGASQWQLMRQQLIESLVLAGIAGVAGVLLSLWGIHLALGLLPPTALQVMPGWVSFGLDWRVLAFAAVASLSTILLVGLWPAREGLRFDLTAALRGSADHSVTGRDPTRRLHLPVVVELMLSLALVIAAVTMLESFRAAASADRGMLMDDRYEVRMGFDERRDTAPSVYTAFVRAMRDNIAAATPGMDVAWGAGPFMIHGDSIRQQGIGIAGTTRNIGWEQFGRLPDMVSDNYFRVLGIHLLSGRSFDSSDVATSPAVVVVSHRFAEDAWPGQNPLGRKLQVATVVSGQATVIGVVSDVTKQDRMANGELAPARDVYFSERQGITCCNRARLIVHTTAPMSSLSRIVTSQLTVLGRDLPVYPRPLREAETVEGEAMGRLLSPVLGTFAVAGFILAILGIYGVVSFAVERRVREIGVRIALGATQRDIVRHMMRDGLTLIAVGTGAGLAAAAALSRIFSAFVMGPVTSHIWGALAVSALFAGIAVVACYLPARRSAGLDPLAALRSE